MTGLIGALRVTLGADTANFEKGMKRARGEMATMQKASTALKAAFVGMAGLLAFDQFASLAKSGLEYASSLGEVASQLGVSTRALQEYRYAASQAGIEQGEMDKALSSLTRRLGAAASGAKAPSEALKRLGVDLRDAKGNIIDAGEAIPLIAEGLKSIESPAERAKILVDLFGKSGQQLAPLMEGGAAGVNGLRDAANSLGLVLSDKLINDADEAADKMAALKQVLEAKIAGAVSENAGAIIELVNALIKLVEWSAKAARAWSAFARMDFSSLGQSFTTNGIYGVIQNMRTQNDINDSIAARGIKSSVELTPSAAAAIEARKGAPRPSSGGSQVAPRQSAPNPWLKKTPSLLQRRNAVGGGGGMANFAPGLGDAGWIKAAVGDAGKLNASLAQTDIMMARMAMQSGAQLVRNLHDAANGADELASAAQRIMDRLFPDEARKRQYMDELRILKQRYQDGGISAERLAEAQAKLRREFILGLPAASSINDGFRKYRDAMRDAADQADVTKVQVVKTFGDMARETLGELDRLSSAIKSGGFLNILSSVIGVGLSLGEAGLFGKSVQSNIASVKGRAFGGPVMANTPYIVGERRAELFVPSSSGRIEPNPGSGRRGGGDTYNLSGNLLTPEWWAQIQKIGDEAAVRGAMGGANMVAERSQQQARQRLGRGR